MTHKMPANRPSELTPLQPACQVGNAAACGSQLFKIQPAKRLQVTLYSRARSLTSLLGVIALMSLFCLNHECSAAELAPPEAVEIKTTDGVMLQGTYYKARAGRNSPVAVLLADEGESRAIFRSLAKSLQDPGRDSRLSSWAVLAVDLRLQGDSNRQRTATGISRITNKKITPAVLKDRIRIDMEAIRSFLVDRNDAGELNLNQYAIVGVGMGAVVATNSTAIDWSIPQLNTGKQGCDVKAVALITPPWKYKAIGMLEALRQPSVQSSVGFLLMYGEEDRRSSADVERIAKQLKNGRLQEDFSSEALASGKFPSVYEAGAKTKLKGSAWMKEAGFEGEQMIANYFEQYVVEPAYPWAKRRLD